MALRAKIKIKISRNMCSNTYAPKDHTFVTGLLCTGENVGTLLIHYL